MADPRLVVDSKNDVFKNPIGFVPNPQEPSQASIKQFNEKLTLKIKGASAISARASIANKVSYRIRQEIKQNNNIPESLFLNEEINKNRNVHDDLAAVGNEIVENVNDIAKSSYARTKNEWREKYPNAFSKAGKAPELDLSFKYNNEEYGRVARQRIQIVGMLITKKPSKSIIKSATKVPIIKRNSNEWTQAVEDLRMMKKGKINIRTETATDAKALLEQAKGKMNRFKNYTTQKYIKGYEVHNVKNLRELEVGNNLQHLKWYDGKSKGHIYYNKAN
jgi:hypothetical protein